MFTALTHGATSEENQAEKVWRFIEQFDTAPRRPRCSTSSMCCKPAASGRKCSKRGLWRSVSPAAESKADRARPARCWPGFN